MWFRKKSPVLAASVFFRGSLNPRFEELRGLDSSGFTVEKLPGTEGTHWNLRVSRHGWGTAEIHSLRAAMLPPPDLIDQCAQLNAEEKKEMESAGSSIQVRLVETSEHILRDRKNLLRFCGEAAGNDGIAVADHVSQLFWSHQSLREELSHNADVDITGIYVLHAVSETGAEKCHWLHSHGLGEIGFCDFDILRPSPELTGRGVDTLRSIAFLSAEGKLDEGSAAIKVFHPQGNVQPIAAAEFQRRASAEDRGLRDAEGHDKRRVVLCNPLGGLLGWRKKPEPSRALRGPFPDQMMVLFSNEATELMEERARGTYEVLRQFAEEFGDLRLPVLVKMGFPTDTGTGREHLWFEAEAFRHTSVTATLQNTPFNIARMSEGMKGDWPVERLTDWAIMTPVGSITPASFRAARSVRANRDRIATFMSNPDV